MQLLDNCCSSPSTPIAKKPIRIQEICHTNGVAYYSLEASFTIWSKARLAKFATIQLLGNGETVRVTLPDYSVLDFTADPEFVGLMAHVADTNSLNVYLNSAQSAAFAIVNSSIDTFIKIRD